MSFRSVMSALFALGIVWSGLICASQRGGELACAAGVHSACHDCDDHDADADHDGAPAGNSDHGCPAGLGSCCSTWDIARVDNFASQLEPQAPVAAASAHAFAGSLAANVENDLQASRAAPNRSASTSPASLQLDDSLQGRAPPHTA